MTFVTTDPTQLRRTNPLDPVNSWSNLNRLNASADSKHPVDLVVYNVSWTAAFAGLLAFLQVLFIVCAISAYAAFSRHDLFIGIGLSGPAGAALIGIIGVFVRISAPRH